MSASSSDLSSSSISSSGHSDGLGRRSLSFDRETGEMLERVHLRPELVAFESLMRERVAQLATFDDERFARPERVERDAATGELTVVAEFVTGSRFSDLLESTSDASIVPGVDVALGYLLEALPALSHLHATGITHGLIDASRTILTPDGQIVFLDPVFGSAVERLNLSRQRLWSRFGIASPAGEGAVTFDVQADIAQVSLAAVALVFGRNLRSDEYPDALPTLLMEVVEVAQIRGSAAFATGFQRLLQRSLPLPGRRPFSSADEAVGEVRQLVRRDIGIEVCRQAVIDFAAQMDTAFAQPGDDDDGVDDSHHDERATQRAAAAGTPRVPELDDFLNRFDHSAHIEHAPEPAAPAHVALEPADHDANETELSLDNLDLDASPSTARDVRDADEVYDLPALDDAAVATIFPTTFAHAPATPAAPVYSAPVEVPRIPAPVQKVPESRFDVTPAPSAEYVPPAVAAVAVPAPEPLREPIQHAALPTAPFEDVRVEAAPAPAEIPPAPAAESRAAVAPNEVDHEAEAEKDTASSRRRKRQQQKSARARKDKLRSTTAVQKAPPPPVPEPPRPASPSGWLVSPQRAAQFDPPVPIPQPAPLPPPPPVRPAHVAMPAVPSFVPTPVGPLPQPVYPSNTHTTSAYGQPSTPSSPHPRPLTPPPPPVVTSPQPTGQLKVKSEPPSGFTPKRSSHFEAPVVHVPPDRFGTLGLGRGDTTLEEEPRAFPWKLAAVAVGVAVIAIIVGRMYLPGRAAVQGEPGASGETPAATGAPAAGNTPPPATDPAADAPIPAGRGRIVVSTDPPGIRVLLDRKPVGETPLKLDVPPGRRMLTFVTSGGEVIRSVRVVAGKTETLDIPVFSGWVAVFAPVVLRIAADGKTIGSTEESRLVLAPGKHLLTLTNKELGYSATQEVEIEPGEVKSVSVDPRGPVNLNALPWAEVWLDGQKLGDTPLAAAPVPLGLREFVFKNPQFGERKVSATIKASGNTPVTVDFQK